MIMLLDSVSVLVLLYSGAVMTLLAGIFVGVLKLFWSTLMVDFISKVYVDNGVNH